MALTKDEIAGMDVDVLCVPDLGQLAQEMKRCHWGVGTGWLHGTMLLVCIDEAMQRYIALSVSSRLELPAADLPHRLVPTVRFDSLTVDYLDVDALRKRLAGLLVRDSDSKLVAFSGRGNLQLVRVRRARKES